MGVVEVWHEENWYSVIRYSSSAIRIRYSHTVGPASLDRGRYDRIAGTETSDQFWVQYTVGKRLFCDMTAVWPLSWTWTRRCRLISVSPLRDCLIVINVFFWHKSIPRPYFLLCVGSWNRPLAWPGQARKVTSHTWQHSHASTHDYTHLLSYIILWHLPSSTEDIHFVLQPPRTWLICKFLLINSVNCQTGLACCFLRSFCAFYLQRQIFSLRAFPWICVYYYISLVIWILPVAITLILGMPLFPSTVLTFFFCRNLMSEFNLQFFQ